MPPVPLKSLLLAAAMVFPASVALAQTTFEAQLLERIQQLEIQLSRLTGQVEELQHLNRQLDDRLTRALSDVEFRLTELEGGDTSTLSTGPSGSGTPAPATTPAPSSSGGGLAPTTAPAGPMPLPLIPPNRGGGIGPSGAIDPMDQTGLGLVGIDGVAGAAPVGGGPVTIAPTGGMAGGVTVASTGNAVPAGDPAAHYDHAYGLYRSGDYAGAIAAFQSFIYSYPTDAFAGNAQYWLGEAHLARGELVEAAHAFRASYQWNPTGTNAAQSLLRLGQAYVAIGQPADGCTAFLRLANDYPTAPAAVLQQLQIERAQLGC